MLRLNFNKNDLGEAILIQKMKKEQRYASFF